jgi:hypothetical protein
VTSCDKTGVLDPFERILRALLSVALSGYAWHAGWTSVEGLTALTLAVVAASTAYTGYCLIDHALAAAERRR